MNEPRLVDFERVFIRDIGLDEAWVQRQLVQKPGLLGLGDVVARDRERRQVFRGRLDLLLQHSDDQRRYTVELQLGPTDPSHIVRCLEYWDSEKSRYPDFEHIAVLVAEEVTGRFLNVIRLFNGHIPIIALQMQALRAGDGMGLNFVRVVDAVSRGSDDESEESSATTTRSDWERRWGSDWLKTADSVFALAKSLDAGIEPSYLQDYIGARIGGRAANFFSMNPRKKSWLLWFRHPKSTHFENDLTEGGMEVNSVGSDAYTLRIYPGEFQKHSATIAEVLGKAREYYFNG